MEKGQKKLIKILDVHYVLPYPEDLWNNIIRFKDVSLLIFFQIIHHEFADKCLGF